MPLLVFISGLVWIGVKTFIIENWRLTEDVQMQVHSAEFRVRRLASRVAKPSNLREKLISDELAEQRGLPAQAWAVICTPERRIVYCTNAAWVGRMLHEVAPPEAVALADKVSASRDLQHYIRGSDCVFAGVSVPGTPQTPLEYIVLVERRPLRAVDAGLATSRKEAWLALATLSVSCLVIWLATFLFVRWRMQDLLRHAGLSGTNMSFSVPLQGADEFAEISRLLSRAEHILQDITENLDDIVWILSPDMTPLYLSPVFERVFRVSRQEALATGNQFPSYIHKEYQTQVIEAFRNLAGGGSGFTLEYRIVRGDGQIRWIESRAFPVRDAEGNLLRVVGISRDVTERKNLEEQIVNVAEQERNSLGNDLHDDACQRLAAMKLKSEALASLLQQEQSPHGRIARELTGQIAGMSALLRNIARGLAPVEVEGDGLSLALGKLVQMQEAIHEVPSFFIEEQPVVVSNKIVATHLYRIAQELITNAARHGAPERIEVRLGRLPDHIRLLVLNDGQPFHDPPAQRNGMGLKIIRHRASAIGATVNIRARTDGTPGTIAECLVSHDLCLATGQDMKPTHAGVDAPGI